MLILVSDEEVDAGVKVAVAMYLYATAHSITALEMAGMPPLSQGLLLTVFLKMSLSVWLRRNSYISAPKYE